jgi:hypothetical protein
MNDRARSNQTRFEHIARRFHDLTVKDIEMIPKAIVTIATLKMEKGRRDTLNYYIRRKGQKKEYIKICLRVLDWDSRSAVVKTILTTNKIK